MRRRAPGSEPRSLRPATSTETASATSSWVPPASTSRTSFHLFGAGRFYVYLGSASGLSLSRSSRRAAINTTWGRARESGEPWPRGISTAMGLPTWWAGQYAKYSTSGADVYYGSPAGPSAGAVWSMPFVVTYQGKFVVVANVNGDAFDDIIVTTLNQEGLPNQAIVFLGSAQGLPELPEGGSPPGVPPAFLFDKWSNVARIGDLDHDGYDDFLVTFGDFYNNETIFHWVYKGSPAGPVPWGEPSPALLTPGRLTPARGRQRRRLPGRGGPGWPDLLFLLWLPFGSSRDLRTAWVPSTGRCRGWRRERRSRSPTSWSGDGAHDRVDLYRGGNDWTFEVTADLSIVARGGARFRLPADGPERRPRSGSHQAGRHLPAAPRRCRVVLPVHRDAGGLRMSQRLLAAVRAASTSW